MSANAPFLAKFAEPLSAKEVEPSSPKAASKKATHTTKVARETTDDQ